MIASTQITNTAILAIITALVFKLLSRKVLFINRKDNRNLKIRLLFKKIVNLWVNCSKIKNSWNEKYHRRYFGFYKRPEHFPEESFLICPSPCLGGSEENL